MTWLNTLLSIGNPTAFFQLAVSMSAGTRPVSEHGTLQRPPFGCAACLHNIAGFPALAAGNLQIGGEACGVDQDQIFKARDIGHIAE